MTNYVKTTDFAAKDNTALPDAQRLVKGTEFEVEFDNIADAIASKANTASPALTGVPTAPTAVAGTNTTQIATTAFVQAALAALYPVGTIYTSTVATNPASTFGFGTWVEFGAGKVLVGQDTGDTSFDVLEETGGSKDAIVVSHSHTVAATGTSGSAGSHSHTYSGTTSTTGAHTHVADDAGHRHYTTIDGLAGTSGSFQSQIGLTTYSSVSGGYESAYARGTADTTQANASTSSTGYANVTIFSSGNHSHTCSGTTSSEATHTHSLSVAGTTSTDGSSGTNANLQPYVVVKMWKRTA